MQYPIPDHTYGLNNVHLVFSSVPLLGSVKDRGPKSDTRSLGKKMIRNIRVIRVSCNSK
jgi:hypothetical protein